MRTRQLVAIVAVTGAVGTFALAGSASAHDDDFRADLTGANEVPGPGDPDGTGKGKVEIDIPAGEVCFKFSWENIATPTMGHIHKGPAGVAGDIVVHLLDNIPPDVIESDDDVRGCVSADPSLLADIVAHPDQYYMNLHNPRFPAGAMRGQLVSR
jgi:hypothetical protein